MPRYAAFLIDPKNSTMELTVFKFGTQSSLVDNVNRWCEVDLGQEVAVSALWQRLHVRDEPESFGGHHQMVQGGPTADHQCSTVWVGLGELSAPVGMQLDGVCSDQPPGPGLGVVDARGAAGHPDQLTGQLRRRSAHGEILMVWGRRSQSPLSSALRTEVPRRSRLVIGILSWPS